MKYIRIILLTIIIASTSLEAQTNGAYGRFTLPATLHLKGTNVISSLQTENVLGCQVTVSNDLKAFAYISSIAGLALNTSTISNLIETKPGLTQAIPVTNFKTLNINNFQNKSLTIAENVGITSRIESVYKGGNIVGYRCDDHELTTNGGLLFNLQSTSTSAEIKNCLSAWIGNGASIEHYGVYANSYTGTGTGVWLKEIAPTQYSQAAIILSTSANLATTNKSAAFIIDQGIGNSFAVGTDEHGGYLGYATSFGTSIAIKAASVSLAGELWSTSTISTSTGIIVSDVRTLKLQQPGTLQAYFTSANNSNGIMIENRSGFDNANAYVAIKQNEVTNYIRTWSTTSQSDFYLPGSLVIESKNPNGILINTSSLSYSQSGSIRFAVNGEEAVRIDIDGSLMVGSKTEIPSAIFVIRSTNRGALLPVMTSTQREAIENPEEGIEVYDKTIHKKCIYTKAGWEVILSKPLAKNIKNLLKNI